jgi:glyoxylase-like metal-dependent hydrolase (beta-lactamase superfamily II)
MTTHMRVLTPHEKIFAFYDGRVEGYRFAPDANWVDDGALSLGIASYVIIDGDEALVYDTHVSPEHGAYIRKFLSDKAITKITVLLSHWHLDHVAGTAVFADCPIISNKKTAAYLAKHKAGIEDGSYHGLPIIKPLIMPTQNFEGSMSFKLGTLNLEFIECNIHSDDATVVWVDKLEILLAGDTMEDTVTYVGEPEHFETHLKDLDRLWALAPAHILPNHGDPDIIALGGYEKTLIRATQQYIRTLRRCGNEPELRDKQLRELISGPLELGWINLYEPYEAVHQKNIKAFLAVKLS